MMHGCLTMRTMKCMQVGTSSWLITDHRNSQVRYTQCCVHAADSVKHSMKEQGYTEVFKLFIQDPFQSLVHMHQ